MSDRNCYAKIQHTADNRSHRRKQTTTIKLNMVKVHKHHNYELCMWELS